MVIAGVVIDKKDEKKLKVFGVKDSKELSPRRREELTSLIEKIAKSIVVLRIPACKIYTYMKNKINLNKIEAMKIAEIIEMSDFDKIYIDAPQKVDSDSIKPNKFMELIRQFIQSKEKKNIDMVVENYLDESIPVVSAASIIAKVERDNQIDELKRKLNFDFSNGYPSDPKTIEFLEKNLRESKEPSRYIRWHWSSVFDTVERLLEKGEALQPWVRKEILQEDSWQKKIKDFFKKKEKCKEDSHES
jgi:ribonuclease HII